VIAGSGFRSPRCDTLSALVLGIFLLQSRPKPPVFDIPVDSIQKGVQGLSPRQAWRRWRTLRAYGLDRTPLLVIEDHDKALLQWRLGMSVALVLAAGGVALCVIPPLIRARPISGGR